MLDPVAFEYRLYRYPFQYPLPTHQGVWAERTGILIRLSQASGPQGFGEIAPLSEFGSETLDQALRWCQQQPEILSQQNSQTIPERLPATRFGLESAWLDLTYYSTDPAPLTLDLPRCGLLPTGPQAFDHWSQLWTQGFRTFKWKIGVTDIQQEQQWCRELQQQLPASARLRLDANGGLTLAQALDWLAEIDPTQIEYIEQPLPATAVSELLQLQKGSPIPIALDEAVTTLTDIKTWYNRGWQGLYIIKPAISGWVSELMTICQTYPIDIVLSSVFETKVGYYHAIQLVKQLGHPRALGYGVNHFFKSDLTGSPMHFIQDQPLQTQFKILWDSLDPI